MNIPQETKVWGKVRHVFGSEVCAVSILEVEKGFRRSKHYHENRINRFIVHSGIIEVILHDQGTRHSLGTGDVFDVEPGALHSFEVIESGIIVEIYWSPPVRQDDIIRMELGGKIETG